MTSSDDMLLGRLAAGRGFVSPAQLEDVLREQARAPGPWRPLGVLLVAGGLLTSAQLVELLEAQGQMRRTIEAYEARRGTGLLFGQILVQQNKSTQNQINKCLEIQRERAEHGLRPALRLGEILIEHGYVDRATVAEVLKVQEKDLLVCSGCGLQINGVGIENRQTYRCRNCGGVLSVRPLAERLHAEETRFGFELQKRES